MKLVTYNIQYSLGRDGEYNLPRIADAVRDADVIALQEVDRFWPHSGMVDQPQAIGALLPRYYWAYAPAFDMDCSYLNDDGTVVNRRRQFGPMLLAKSPLRFVRRHVFPKYATVDEFNMDYGAIEGIIETPSGPLRILSLHLNHHSTRERLLQLETLFEIHRRAAIGGGAWCGTAYIHDRDWSNAEPPPPMPEDAILMGDFNSQPGSPEYERLIGPSDPFTGRVHHVDRFVDAWVKADNDESDGFTWQDTGGDEDAARARLDYCFVSTRLAGGVRRAWVDLQAQGSDHYPCWTEIDL